MEPLLFAAQGTGRLGSGQIFGVLMRIMALMAIESPGEDVVCGRSGAPSPWIPGCGPP